MVLLHPQFVKFNGNIVLPENIRNKYFAYYTVSGLFDSNGMIPAIYVELDKAYLLFNFIKEISNDINIAVKGIESFVINNDYYINESLYNILNVEQNEVEDIIVLPNYLTNIGMNMEYFDTIDNIDEIVEYFHKQNYYQTFDFSEEELLNFYSTFCKQILKLTLFDPETTEDTIHSQVLNYFANFKSDNASVTMSMMFNSMYGTSSSAVTCGCNSGSSTSSICTTSCIEYYKQAMDEYLKTMLGSDVFYYNWFYVTDPISGIKEPNKLLINAIKTLINEFLELDINISTSKESPNMCKCPTVSSIDDSCNRGILKNYLDVLEYIEQNKIEENINKIKIHGQEFGKLLPNLQF
jgi:hypothetical protein